MAALIDVDWWPGHAEDCSLKSRDPHDFQLANPDSDGHCEACHCTCADMPCGHWIGCPGC